MPFLGFALGAIGGVDPAMPQPDLDARQRQLLVIGIKPQRHRRAGAERGEQQIVRPRTAVEAAGIFRLVGEQTMGAGDNFLLECPAPRFAHDDDSGQDIVVVSAGMRTSVQG